MPIRSGFPKICPIGRAVPVNGGNCMGCRYHIFTEIGQWRCEQPDYQNEPGIHFCVECGTELSPWDQSHGKIRCGWEVCRNAQPAQ